jgi:hypothetical protein
VLQEENLGGGLLHLDGEWQRFHGDLTFDPQRFPGLANLTDDIRNASLDLGIQVRSRSWLWQQFFECCDNLFCEC